MPWPLLSLRDRRKQVRDDIATHLPGADATVPNSVLRVLADAMANLTHDNDLHLNWLARMMMPDTAEGEFVERWANIWLPAGRKAASFASGSVVVTGDVGAIVPSGTELTVNVIDEQGNSVAIAYEVTQGVTLASTSATVPIRAVTAGPLANLDEGAEVSIVNLPAAVDGVAVVAAPGLAGGAEAESDVALIERYIARIQEPPHGGAKHDYVAWALELPGITRAWAAQEMGVGTLTVRVMLDEVRADSHGIPEDEDNALVFEYVDALRPVTVADFFVEAPIAQPLNITVADLVNDTPEVRANIALEIKEMLRARARPGGIIYGSWISEAISTATGEDHHSGTFANVTPNSAGHIVVPGVITYT